MHNVSRSIVSKSRTTTRLPWARCFAASPVYTARHTAAAALSTPRARFCSRTGTQTRDPTADCDTDEHDYMETAAASFDCYGISYTGCLKVSEGNDSNARPGQGCENDCMETAAASPDFSDISYTGTLKILEDNDSPARSVRGPETEESSGPAERAADDESHHGESSKENEDWTRTSAISLNPHDFSQLRQPGEIRFVPSFQDIYHGTFATQYGGYERSRLRLEVIEKQLDALPIDFTAQRWELEAEKLELKSQHEKLREVVWGPRLK